VGGLGGTSLWGNREREVCLTKGVVRHEATPLQQRKPRGEKREIPRGGGGSSRRKRRHETGAGGARQEGKKLTVNPTRRGGSVCAGRRGDRGATALQNGLRWRAVSARAASPRKRWPSSSTGLAISSCARARSARLLWHRNAASLKPPLKASVDDGGEAVRLRQHQWLPGLGRLRRTLAPFTVPRLRSGRASVRRRSMNFARIEWPSSRMAIALLAAHAAISAAALPL